MSSDIVICVAAGALLLCAAVCVFIMTGGSGAKAYRAAYILFVGCMGMLLLGTALGLLGFLRPEGAEHILTWAAAGAALTLAALALFRLRKKQGAAPVHCAFLPKLLIVAAVLEIFVFNFNAYRLMSGEYPVYDVDFSKVKQEGFILGEDGKLTGNGRITLRNLGFPVGTLTVAVVSDKNTSVVFYADFSDETYASLRINAVTGEAVNGNKKTYIVPVNASGDVSKLRVTVKAEEKEKLTIEKISLNRPLGLRVSPLRFLIIVLLVFSLHALIRSPRLKNSFEGERKIAWVLAGCATLVFILTALLAACLKSEGLKADFSQTGGDQMTQELVDAFKNGQASLLREPAPELLALENPYDKTQRTGIDHEWDHLLYNGKYYSYYGIAPVLLLFLPYNLITGFYFPGVWAVFLFGAGGIAFITLTYMLVIKKFHKSIPLYILLSGLIITQLASGIWYCFSKAKFYEIAQSAGFLFVTAGVYFLLKSNVIGEGMLKLWSLCLSSALFSLAVLSRPTTAVYCVCALFFIAAGFFKWKKERGRGCAKYLVYALLPFIAFGGVQMFYNYVRFGSVTDFGISYSLTINDFTNTQFHLHFALIGFYNYLLAFPQFFDRFPFFSSSVQCFNPNGYYFIATNYAVGLAFTAPPACGLMLGSRAFRKSVSPQKRLYAALIALSCVIAPFVIIFSIWESGYGIRYGVDFNWQMVLGGLIALFTLYGALKSEEARRIVGLLMVFALVLSFAMNFSQVYNWVAEGIHDIDISASFKSFARLFEFWR